MTRRLNLPTVLAICLTALLSANPTAAEVPTSNIPESADAVVSLNVSALLASPTVKESNVLPLLQRPTEGFGLELDVIDRIDCVYQGGKPIGLIVRYHGEFGAEVLGGRRFQEGKVAVVKVPGGDKKFMAKFSDAMYLHNARTVVFAERDIMPNFVNATGKEGVVASELAASSADRHLLIVLQPRPAAKEEATEDEEEGYGPPFDASNLPFDLFGYLEGVRVAKFKADLDPNPRGRLTVTPLRPSGAAFVRDQLDTAIGSLEEKYLGVVDRTSGESGLTIDSLFALIANLYSEAIAKSTPKIASNGDVTCNFTISESYAKQTTKMASVVFDEAKKAALRNSTAANLKNLALALQNHHDVLGKFPGVAVQKDGKGPRMSWRVQLTPFMEQKKFFDNYNQNEAWDSPANRKLQLPMHWVFTDPHLGSPAETAQGKTRFVVLVGEETAFPPDKQLKFRSMADGTSNTIMIVECDAEHAVDWSSPNDIQYDASDPLKGLPKRDFQVAFADSGVMTIPADIDPKVFHALVTRNGDDNAISAPFFRR